MKLRLLWVGKTREPYLAEGIRLFRQRIQRYMAVETVAVRGEKIRQTANETILRDKECERLLQAVVQDDRVLALDPSGKMPDSEAFSRLLGDYRDRGVRSMAFVLGSPLGLNEEILQRADFRFSLSPLTFTHEMARLILMEQIYRALTILAGEKYHK